MVRNWALAIGINQYDFLQPLKYASRDALLMREFLFNEAGFERVLFFSDDSPNIGCKTNRPDCNNLLQVLQQISEKPFLEKGDTFWFFFSGHGMHYNNRDYLMPSDGDPDNIEKTAIPIDYISECLQRCGADNIVIILDACRDRNNTKAQGIGLETRDIARQTGIISIFACSPGEYSYEIEALQQGVFTHSLVEGLSIKGQCATVARLNEYLSFRVSKLVHQYKKAQQKPYIIAEPANKAHLILVSQHATLHDINTLKIHAFQAEYYNSRCANANHKPQNSYLQLNVNYGSSVLIKEEQDVLSLSPEIVDSALTYNFGFEQTANYKHLQDLLAAGKWKEADRETIAIMLKIAKREKEGWLNVASINKFPCNVLCTIDQLWLKYSDGRFGYSVQKHVWESVGGGVDADYQTWCKFCDRVGWRINENWQFYFDLTFTTDAPQGHFPAAGVVNMLTAWQGWVVGSFCCSIGFSALVSKLESCDVASS